MIARDFLLGTELRSLYGKSPGDLGFERVLRDFPVETDAELATVIEADGRLRLELRRQVTLNRYMGAVPDLAGRRDALDAAIDMALRALARTGRGDEGSIEELMSAFPALRTSIREAAALNNALWSTTQIHRHVMGGPIRELPCDFGPGLDTGVRRYELRELLGEGAFGQVYLAVDRKLSEKDHLAFVAIKLFSGDDGSRRVRKQLVDEATKARRIAHPNVAQVLDIGRSEEGETFVVYEYVTGGDLTKWARRGAGSRDIDAAVSLVAKVARGVHAAHMAGLVHCDLKPNNVVITGEGEPKVTDFGVAIRAEERTRARERGADAAPIGNLAFMSPEQYRMEAGALTIPTDIYALGGILYWVLTGIVPNGTGPEEIRRTHDPEQGRRKPPSLGSHCPAADADLEAICKRAMAVRPDDRFSSAGEVAESLEAWLRREPLPWTGPSVFRRARLWTKRKPAPAVAVAVIFGLLVASGVVIQHLASVAREKRFEAAVAEARLEEEERIREEFRARLRGVIARLRQAQEQGLTHEILPQIWLEEWLFGPTVLGDGPERFDLWKVRVEVVRSLLERAKTTGGENRLQTLLWESALGFWLIREGEYAEAEMLLADNDRRWKEIVDPADPWLAHLEGMRACARLGSLKEDGDFTVRRRDFEEIASRLERMEQFLSLHEHGTPIHHLVLGHLQMVYGPDLLDRPERVAGIEETLRAMRD